LFQIVCSWWCGFVNSCNLDCFCSPYQRLAYILLTISSCLWISPWLIELCVTLLWHALPYRVPTIDLAPSIETSQHILQLRSPLWNLECLCRPCGFQD